MATLLPLPSSPSRRRLLMAGFGLSVALLVAGMAFVGHKARQEAQARKDPAALAFEAAPKTWLTNPRALSDFEKSLARGEIRAVGMSGSTLLYTDKQGQRLSTSLVDCGPACTGEFVARLSAQSAEKNFVLTRAEVDTRTLNQRLDQSMDEFGKVMLALTPVLLIGGLLFYQMRGGSFSGGGTKLAVKPDMDFDDVIGADEAKRALRRVAAFMKDPKAYTDLGARAPRGVLIDGPPGTGKTLLAKALAGECGANFISVDGSHFSSMFMGAGIGKVKELFQNARKHAPCIIFIDELDGLGRRSRGESSSAGEQEHNRIINRFLVELDGFSPLDNVVIVGATNHIDNIDPALRRPGRFDMVVRTEMPTQPEREAMFGLYLGQVKAAQNLDVASLARTSMGMSPADIANCVNRAASYAAEAGDPEVGAEMLYRSIETFQLGGEVSSTKSILTEDTRKRIAVHESGHGLVAHVLQMGSVERVSIEPRGGALGVTYVARHTEEPLYGERELRSRLAMMLAGREAELLIFGNTSSGASDDLKRASELATSMIGTYGFGETFGLLSMAGVPKELIGPDVQKNLLDEARSLLEVAQAECREVLIHHRHRLEKLTAALLEDETVSGQPLQALLNAPHEGHGARPQVKLLESNEAA